MGVFDVMVDSFDELEREKMLRTMPERDYERGRVNRADRDVAKKGLKAILGAAGATVCALMLNTCMTYKVDFTDVYQGRRSAEGAHVLIFDNEPFETRQGRINYLGEARTALDTNGRELKIGDIYRVQGKTSPIFGLQIESVERQ